MAVLDALTFENHYVDSLPGDPVVGGRPRQVPGAAWSRVLPSETGAPSVIAVADEVAELLGLSDEQVSSDQFRDVVSGNLVLPGMDPFAMR